MTVFVVEDVTVVGKVTVLVCASTGWSVVEPLVAPLRTKVPIMAPYKTT